MKVKELKNILEQYNDNLDISFGYIDSFNEVHVRCEVDIEFDERSLELDVTLS